MQTKLAQMNLLLDKMSSRYFWILSLALVLIGFILISGESPAFVAKVVWQSATGSKYDFGMTLFYATHFILTGLSVALCFRVGFFNVGAEGQLNMGTALGVAASLLTAPLGFAVSMIAGVLFGFLGGALWAYIPAILKIRRGAHEVISTIMMNFVASGLSAYLILYHFPNPDSQRPESALIPATPWLRDHDLMAMSFDGAPVSFTFILAILLCLMAEFWINKTILGFSIRISGVAPEAARIGKIPVGKIQLWIFTLAGGIAGLTFLTEALGGTAQYRLGFSADYGFTGIAVALVAANRPAAIIFSGLLFGVLHKGAGGLEFETNSLTKEFSYIMQALLIFIFIIRGRRNDRH